MSDKEIAEFETRIVCALIEVGPYKAAEYPQLLKIYDAVSQQIAKTAIDVRKILDTKVLKADK